MKKLFFPKSSSSHGEERQRSPAKRDKKQSPQKQWKAVTSGNLENKLQSSGQFFCDQKVTEKKTISRTRSLVLKRSRSFQMSSAEDNNGGFSKQIPSGLTDSKNITSSLRMCNCSDCDYNSRNSDSRTERFNVATIQIPHAEVLRDHACSCPSNSSSPRSSFGSTTVPGKVLDLYIDGEHHQERKFGISSLYPRSSKERDLFFSSDVTSREYSLESKNQHESPRKLAKDVVERLLRIEHLCDPKKRGDKDLDGQRCKPTVDISEKNSPLEDILDKHLDGKSFTLLSEETDDPTDLALQWKLEEVKEKVRLLSGQLAHGGLFQYNSGDLSALCQTVRSLLDEERNLALDMYDQLQSRIAERIAAKEAASKLKGEMNSAITKLEKEKDEMHSRLQKELDRRSGEWEIKLREFESEEQRLRDRVRELAEQNVSLQREVSGFYNKEKEYTDRLSHMEIHLKNLTAKMDTTKSENDSLQKKLSGIQDKLRVAEEVQSSMERNYKEKEREYMELTKVVSRLQGTCNEQERTVDGLRQCLKSENLTNKLQIEQLRLTGVEQDLRRQLETSSAETNTLRSENIYLLERIKGMGKVGGSSALKLEQEVGSYVQCLKNTGLSLLNESIQMCENLLLVLERKTSSEGFVESHSFIQYSIKVQGFRKDLEQLTRSLRKTASVLQENTELVSVEPQLRDTANRKTIEDDLKSEVKAERLLTSILKEKMYSKEKEVEKMQVELARSLRSHDVLKREIQEGADAVSCVNHKMKNLELQMIKKDGTINELQGDLRSCEEELTTTRGILVKVSQERELIWQQVEEYSEKNMLLNREVVSLKKKIEGLEEDTLLKDGQISILKDSLSNAKSFNILFESEQMNEF